MSDTEERCQGYFATETAGFLLCTVCAMQYNSEVNMLIVYKDRGITSIKVTPEEGYDAIQKFAKYRQSIDTMPSFSFDLLNKEEKNKESAKSYFVNKNTGFLLSRTSFIQYDTEKEILHVDVGNMEPLRAKMIPEEGKEAVELFVKYRKQD